VTALNDACYGLQGCQHLLLGCFENDHGLRLSCLLYFFNLKIVGVVEDSPRCGYHHFPLFNQSLRTQLRLLTGRRIPRDHCGTTWTLLTLLWIRRSLSKFCPQAWPQGLCQDLHPCHPFSVCSSTWSCWFNSTSF
jgi:hypothetical protein